MARTLTIDVAAVNDAPRIIGPAGGASAALSVAENSTAVTTVTAIDPEADTVAYSLAGGADAARFAIDAGSRRAALPRGAEFRDARRRRCRQRLSGGRPRHRQRRRVFGSQSLAVTVTDADEAPAAAADSYRADAGTTLVVGRADGVLANDADPAKAGG